MHYFRLDPARWRSGLEAIRDLGLPIVETYVPWGVHEIAEGRFDFGEREPRNDLGAFHDLVLGQGSLPLEVLERVVDAWDGA